MTFEDLQTRARSSRPWIFGVFATLAPRFGWSTGLVRVVAVVMLSWLTIPTLLAYVCTAFFLEETRERTQSRTAKWARKADRFIEDMASSMRRQSS